MLWIIHKLLKLPGRQSKRSAQSVERVGGIGQDGKGREVAQTCRHRGRHVVGIDVQFPRGWDDRKKSFRACITELMLSVERRPTDDD